MVTSDKYSSPVKHERGKWKRRSGAFPILAFLLLASIHVQAQDHSVHTYTARLIRTAGFNPMKPMLADVLEWLPDAEVSLAREEDVLTITMERELSSGELREHLEPHGVQLASFAKDGISVDPPLFREQKLPWLSGTDGGPELSPSGITARKDAWVKAHPDEYERLIHSMNAASESR